MKETRLKASWPVIMDCEGIDIEQGDILAQEGGVYIIADTDTLEAIGDGSTWRAIGSIEDGEDLSAALERIQREISR
jgi:hypothetical protein